MPTGPDPSREMTPEEAGEVDTLLRAAFETSVEADLVKRLQVDGDMALELVIPCNGRIGAYAALSRMRAPVGWLCLAPLAVLPEFQAAAPGPEGRPKEPRHLGSRLAAEIAAGAKDPENQGIGPVVVLGEVSFYERAGFSKARAARLTSPYPIDYTMLAAPGGDAPALELIYPTAFEEL